MATQTTIIAIKKAAKLAGGQNKLAKAIGVPPSSVANWITRDPIRHRPVPVPHCVAIENLTQGKVTRRQLRPNDWQAIWPELERRVLPRPTDHHTKAA